MKLKFGETEVEVNLFLFIWSALKRKIKMIRWPDSPLKIRVFVLFVLALLFLSGIGYSLYYFSQTQKWSPEVNAAVINLYVSTLTFIIMISVTVYFNIQTQKITLETQKMNYNAIKFQARAPIRDEILKERMRIYPKIHEDLTKMYDPCLRYYNERDSTIFTNVSISDVQKIIQTNKQTLKRLENHSKNPFISNKVRSELNRYIEWRRYGKIPPEIEVNYHTNVREFIDIHFYSFIEGILFDILLSTLSSELQLEEVEEDIKSLKSNEKSSFFYRA